MIDVEAALAELKEEMFANPLVKEYFRIRQMVAENVELKALKTQINEAQVKLSLSMNNQVKHEDYKTNYEQLVGKYESHPLIENFTQLQTEVRHFLQDIVDLLE